MPIFSNLQSAKIIPFPLQQRLGLAGRDTDPSKVMNEAEQPHVSYDSWYHEEAVRDERTRKQ